MLQYWEWCPIPLCAGVSGTGPEHSCSGKVSGVDFTGLSGNVLESPVLNQLLLFLLWVLEYSGTGPEYPTHF